MPSPPTSYRKFSPNVPKGREIYSTAVRSDGTVSRSAPGKRQKVSKTIRETRSELLEKRRYKTPDLSFVGAGANSLRSLEEELDNYWDFLLGREELPIDNGVASLMESAVAIHSRCCEIQALLQEAEYQGAVPKGSNFYRFRTGPLRSIVTASARAIDLGSRRITIWAETLEETRSFVPTNREEIL